MSAYLCDDHHILGLAVDLTRRLTSRHGSDPGYPIGIHGLRDAELATKIANILLAENYRSVNYRYREDDPPHTLEIDFSEYLNYPTWPLADLFKALDCLEYQSCECDDWQMTQAYQIVNLHRSHLWRALPGYEDAEWGLKKKAITTNYQRII